MFLVHSVTTDASQWSNVDAWAEKNPLERDAFQTNLKWKTFAKAIFTQGVMI